MQAQTQNIWYDNCGKRFLRPTIEIVKPKVVIALGLNAMNTILASYNITTPFKSLQKAVEYEHGIRLCDDTLCSQSITVELNRPTLIVKWLNKSMTGRRLKHTLIHN